jgi:hypothetical protein
LIRRPPRREDDVLDTAPAAWRTAVATLPAGRSRPKWAGQQARATVPVRLHAGNVDGKLHVSGGRHTLTAGRPLPQWTRRRILRVNSLIRRWLPHRRILRVNSLIRRPPRREGDLLDTAPTPWRTAVAALPAGRSRPKWTGQQARATFAVRLHAGVADEKLHVFVGRRTLAAGRPLPQWTRRRILRMNSLIRR